MTYYEPFVFDESKKLFDELDIRVGGTLHLLSSGR
jgi:hypothetical protein